MIHTNFNEPTTFIILGGTGDLSKKKLIPSLFYLYLRDALPDEFRCIGFARSECTDESYRQFAREVIEADTTAVLEYGEDQLTAFLDRIEYHLGLFDDEKAYESLERRLDDDSHRVFYLATSPRFHETIFKNLSYAQVTRRRGPAWARVLIEKPFGTDLDTDRNLDKTIARYFDEEQIYRIDHYLTKDAVQNILAFRFANVLFGNSWSAEHIEHVHIRLLEDFGVEERGAFYDGIGALRDVGQNHLLQMLAMVAMEDPGELTPDAICRSRSQVVAQLRVYEQHEVAVYVTRGQYEGYTDIPEVAKDSTTETYFCLEAYVDSERFKNVPFYLESGKMLDRRLAEIEVTFKPGAPCTTGDVQLHEHQNVLTFQIQPTQAISVQFWSKKPGLTFELEPQLLSFNCDGQEQEEAPDAYEKLLFDAIQGDHTLFARSDEIESAWEFITPIITNWGDTPLHIYPKGSSPADITR